MSGYSPEYQGSGAARGRDPPYPARTSGYRQGINTKYETQEITESPPLRIPYQETEVWIGPVPDDEPPGGYHTSPSILSRYNSLRKPEHHAVGDSRSFIETEERTTSNMAVETAVKPVMESERISDGFSEAYSYLGYGTGGYYDTSRGANWTASPPTPKTSTLKATYEPAYEKIAMTDFDYFSPGFQTAAAPPTPQSAELKTTPNIMTAPRPPIPHVSVSDPFPIPVEPYYTPQSATSSSSYSTNNDWRGSQLPEPVNLPTDSFYNLPARSNTTYRREPRYETTAPRLDANGLPSLDGLLGQNAATNRPGTANSFNSHHTGDFYGDSGKNTSSISLVSSAPSINNYGSNTDLSRVPSYATIRPDNDNRYNKSHIPPPPVRYSSQKAGGKDLSLQERKLEYVVNEINKRDEYQRLVMEESRRYGHGY